MQHALSNRHWHIQWQQDPCSHSRQRQYPTPRDYMTSRPTATHQMAARSLLLLSAAQVLPFLQVGSMLTFGISSGLCMTGNDVKFDPDAVLPPWFEYLSETQRTNKVTTVLERKFGDKFVIKSGSGYNKRFCQFRGGGDIFILHRAQPLGAVILINRRVDLYQFWAGIWGSIWRRTQMWGYRTEIKGTYRIQVLSMIL